MDARTWRAFRNLTWFLGLIALGISLILQGVLSPAMAGSSVVLDGYQITFLGVTYNSDQTSTWRYEVRPASATRDLSHWVLGLCTTHQVLSSDPNGTVGKDPTTGLWGIKWEQPLRTTDGPRPYTFVLNGWFEVGTTQVAVKAGRDPESGTIDGPSCTPPAPSPTPAPSSTPTPAPTEPPAPTPTPVNPTPTSVPTEPPTPTPAPTEPPAPTPTPIDPTPTPVPTEPPTPTPVPTEPPAPTPTPVNPTPTPVIEPPTPTPVPTEPPAPTPTPIDPIPTPVPTEPPAPTPTPVNPTPTPVIEPPTPTPVPTEPPAPTPTPVVYPPVPTPTPGVNLPPTSPPEISSPPASDGASDLLPVTGAAVGAWSMWSLLLARLSGLFMGLGLAAHVMLVWRSRNG